MYYTGLERHTVEELRRLAHDSNNRVAIELCKRLDEKDAAIWTLRKENAEAVALAGVNPIPLNIGEEG